MVGVCRSVLLIGLLVAVAMDNKGNHFNGFKMGVMAVGAHGAAGPCRWHATRPWRSPARCMVTATLPNGGVSPKFGWGVQVCVVVGLLIAVAKGSKNNHLIGVSVLLFAMKFCVIYGTLQNKWPEDLLHSTVKGAV